MNSKVLNIQPYYSRLLTLFFYTCGCGFLLSPLSLYFLDFPLSFSHSPSPQHSWFGGGKHGGRWVFLRLPFLLTSLSLSLFDLLSIVMFMGVWWWIFGGGGSLMVGIDGGGYFVWVFDGGYLLAVCVWWWVLVVMGVWRLEFDVGYFVWVFDGGYLLVVVVGVWWWVFVIGGGGGGVVVAMVIGCFAMVNPWIGMGIKNKK